MRYKTIITLIMMPMAMLAQTDDVGTDLAVKVTRDLGTRAAIAAQADVRTRDNVSQVERIGLDVGGTYDILPWLKADAGYVLLVDHTKRTSVYDSQDRDVRKGLAMPGDPKNERVFWQVRHRLYSSLTASYKAGGLRLSLRERWQYTYRPEKVVAGRYNYLYQKSDNAEHLYRGKGKNVLRSKLTLRYKIRKHKVSPFVSAEAFNAWSVQKIRYTAGAEWKPVRHNELQLFYRYQYVNTDDYEPNRHIIGLSYKHKL